MPTKIFLCSCWLIAISSLCAQNNRTAPTSRDGQNPAALPELSARSNLRSFASAHSDEDKCEVLFNWLESAKTNPTAAPNYAYRMPAEMLRVFRDEPMTAVFGMTYDRTENRWRLDLYEKTIARCLGVAPRTATRNIPFAGIRGGNKNLAQYSQEFAQYRQLLDQAFQGQSGPFEPSAVSRYAQQVREQISWAGQTMAGAVSNPPTQASFDQLTSQRQTLARQLATLTPSERTQVENFLAHRQGEMASVIAENWLRDAGNTERTITSARMLQKQRAAFGSVLAALDNSAQTAWANRYNRLVDSLIADAVKADTAKIGSVPETLDGVLQLTALRGGFETTFGDFHGISSVDSAREDYSRGRMRILAMAFPTWRKEVDGLPLEAPAVASKHQMFESLFPGKEDRATPVYTQYEAPLKSKEDQLRAVLASNTRKDPERAENSNGTVGGQERGGTSERRGTVASSSFTARGLASESTLTKMFSGDFLHIDFDRNDVKFNGLFDQYLVAYSRHCGDALPPDKVEMTKRECRWSTVTEIRNGWGTLISSTESCNEWETVHVGWAKPALYSAKKAVDMQRAGDVGRELSQTLSDITSRNLLGGVMQKLAAARAIADDMDSLVQINACKSPGLERFEENLRLFALNQQPIRMDGKSLGSAVTVIPGIPFKDQNYTKLLTDLVEDDAQKWGAMAKYVPGSVGGASVSLRDDVGRPVKVVASYGWESMLGRNRGSVTLTFTDGLPNCFFYSETPAVCHAANRKVVASYAEGGYQQ